MIARFYFFMLLLLIIMVPKNSWALEIAESLQYPFSNGTYEQYNAFGTQQSYMHWNAGWGGYHLAYDVGSPTGTKVYASADGTVVESQNHPHGGYGSACGASGYLVLIESQLTDGTPFTIIYGHVRSGSYSESTETGLVPEGTVVRKGQYIATIADYPGDNNEDGVCGDGNWDHLHWGVRVASYNTVESIRGYGSSEGYWDDPVDFINNHQTDCTDYSSYITDLKSDFGNFIGDPTNGEPHLYYQLGEHSENVCIQDYDDSGTSDGTSAIIYDYAGEARQAYLVRSGFWNLYANTCGGPEGNCNQNGVVDCGAPIGNEYSQGGSTARQDFQSCYFYWNGSSSANTYPEVGPGWFKTGGWDGEVSYAFAEAYANNGARNDMGEPSDVIDGAGVHYWGNNSNLPLVQDFEGGNYGWAILMYNEEIGDAYAIHTAFWETYQRFGPGTYGAPCTDEYIGSDGKTYQDFEHYTFRYYNGNVSTQARTEGCSERAPATDDDDLIYNWPDPEDQYLFIDTDQNGVMDPCLRRGDLILCDENRDGDSDYAFSYGDGISATYFPLRFGVAVVYNYGTFYLDEDADGYTNRTITFGVSGDQGHYLGNGGALGIQRYTRYFLIDNNADGYEEWFYPFGWGLSNQHYYLADMNGDNITDLVFRQGNLFTVDTSQDGSDDFYFTYGWGDADDYYFADLISDGTDEVIVRRGDTFYVLLNESISRTCPSCSHTHDFSFHYGNGL